MAKGDWTRADIARQRAKQLRIDQEKEERIAHHVKYGDKDVPAFCQCWGCCPHLVGTETEGQE